MGVLGAWLGVVDCNFVWSFLRQTGPPGNLHLPVDHICGITAYCERRTVNTIWKSLPIGELETVVMLLGERHKVKGSFSFEGLFEKGSHADAKAGEKKSSQDNKNKSEALSCRSKT
ncbi:uncharacterized protein LOC143305983 [Osmia lignaria lignaria]|uniref:uncharacterized protein LOC143305983 n=1 Tax=Osmia lignaria lignaria TaxID=1437193 RepID=UPI00402B9043